MEWECGGGQVVRAAREELSLTDPYSARVASTAREAGTALLCHGLTLASGVGFAELSQLRYQGNCENNSG